MPVFLNSKSHLGLCTVAVLVASSCGLRSTLDSESTSPGATPTPNGAIGSPDASAPGGGLKADAGAGPDLTVLAVPDARTSDLSPSGIVPLPVDPDAGLLAGPDAGRRVGPDAGPP